MTSVKIALTGDFCPIGRIHQAAEHRRWAGLFPGISDLFARHDLVVVDLECPLTEGGSPIVKTGPIMRAHPHAAELLAEIGCDVAATANNHFMDFGWQGAQDTYQALEKNGIEWVGSGASIGQASAPLIKQCGDAKVALLNLTENEWSTTHDESPGCNPIDYPDALHTITEARKKADFVIVILHGGHEHYELPSPRMKKQFRFMIDAGADAVIGHHTHIISGFEEYRGKLIFYSLGNFCIDSDDQRSSPWNLGLVLSLQLSRNRLSEFKLHPVRQNDDKPGVELLNGSEKERVIRNFQKLSEVITDDSLLAARFEQYCTDRAAVALSQIQPYSNRILLALHRRGLLPSPMGRNKRKLLAALCQCESHREVLLWALKKSL